MSFSMTPVGFANDVLSTINNLRQEFLEGALPPTLFHYTSLGGVIGIVNSRSVRATCIDDLRDYSELHHGADLIHDEISKSRANGIGAFADAVLSKVIHMVRNRRRRTFVACFCASPASEFHWKNYGEYCLTFETDGRREPLLRTSVSRVSLQYYRVIYDEQRQRAAARRAITSLLAAIDRNTAGTGPGSWVEWNAEFLARTAAEVLLDLIVAFKKPNFAGDAEWRLVVRPHVALCSSALDSEDEGFELFVRTEKNKRYVELHSQRTTGFVPIILRPPVPFSAITESPYIANPERGLMLRRILNENGCDHIEIKKGFRPSQ